MLTESSEFIDGMHKHLFHLQAGRVASSLHYIRKLYSGLIKSNFKDHYGDIVITQ